MARKYLSQISVKQIPIARTVTVLAALVVPTGLIPNPTLTTGPQFFAKLLILRPRLQKVFTTVPPP